MQWIRRNLKILLPTTVVGLGVVAYLAFAVFGIHTLFIDDKVDEAGPIFASGATETAAEAPADAVIVDADTVGVEAAADPLVVDVVPDDTVAPSDTKVDKLAAGGEVQASLEASAAVEAQTDTDADGASGVEPATEAESVPEAAPETTVPAEPQITTVVDGSFIPRGRYSGEGQALVLTDGSEQRFLRFENFSTDNGPDLSVYLVNSDANADEGTFDDDFIDLGDLKGNIGDQNYEISPDVDLSVYDTVVVWCVRFGSAFTAADLMGA